MHTVEHLSDASPGSRRSRGAAKHPQPPDGARHRQFPRAHRPQLRAGDLVSGARAVLPAVVAFAPLALMVGAAVAASDNRLAAWLSTWTIHGGAAQLVTLDVVAQQSGWIAAATAGLLVQARLSAYSTAMVADWRTAPLGLRLLAGVRALRRPLGARPVPEHSAGAGSTSAPGWHSSSPGRRWSPSAPRSATSSAGSPRPPWCRRSCSAAPWSPSCDSVRCWWPRPPPACPPSLTVMASAGVAFVSAAAVGIVAGLVADRPRVRDRAEAVAS